MGLLDRLRPQPAWKHPDPAVRAAAVQDLPEEDAGLLVSIAREDPDPKVRRTAVRRLGDPATLADIVRTDADVAIREEASGALVTLAVDTVDEAIGRAALSALTDSRQLAAIARSATHEDVSREALSRLTDLKAISLVARQGMHAATRLEALARVNDPGELATVAAKTDHKDVALAALERVTGPDLLRMVAVRAKNKASARRARAMLRELDAEHPQPAVTEAESTLRRQQHLCAEVEALATSARKLSADADLALLEDAWTDLLPDVDEALAARFAAGCEALRAGLASAAAERARRDQEVSTERARRAALIDAIEQAADEQLPETLQRVRAEWQPLEPMDVEQARLLEERFAQACQAGEQRIERVRRVRERRRRMERLCEEAEQLASAPELSADRSARERAKAVRGEWTALAGSAGDEDPALTARFQEAVARLSVREADRRQAREQQRSNNLSRLERFCAEAEQLPLASGLTLRRAGRALREIRATLSNLGPLPSSCDQEALAARLKAAQAALFPKIQELRDIDAWERWSNVGVQEELCARVEALRPAADPVATARQLRELEDRWRKVGPVPQEKAQILWRRFKSAHDEVHARCSVFFAAQAEQRAAHLARKIALCEQAEALALSTDWINTAEAIKRFQAEWKTIGPASRGQERAIWERFRKACDQFFTRRHDDLARRKDEWSRNLARKEALCLEAERLAESVEWEQAAIGVRRLQSEWKTVGSVRKNRSEAIWQRFRAACDRFYDRYRHRDQLDRAVTLADREALCAEVEAWLPPPDQPRPQAAPEGLRERLLGARSKWQLIGGLPRDQGGELHQRFERAFTRVLAAFPDSFRNTDLDVARNRERMEELCVRVERLLSPATPPAENVASPAARLATLWREALASNTIGGKVDEDSRWRAANEDVKNAQAAWQRVGYVPDETRRRLGDRFDRACRRFFEQRDRRPHPGKGPPTAARHSIERAR